jgi:hypothetical protein
MIPFQIQITQVAILPSQLMTATTELVKLRGAVTSLAKEKIDLEAELNKSKVSVASYLTHLTFH